ncbi:hypothetical protein MSG28_007225 [Choristoneura fumiferana]|uniref:Uncharacterized protein n=1 Tax=Choristoneura fumiferana TaxID=7141 RepID=A0ACC0JWE2_CHOFU|nr:hypothetical protein MSG28_007225 [Choristoneura fumiferana]
MAEDVVAVTRHAPRTRRSVLLVARTAFRAPDAARPPPARPAALRGRPRGDPLRDGDGAQPYARDPTYINGVTEWAAAVRRRVPLAASRLLAGARRDGAHTELGWRALPPGAVLALRVAPRAEHRAALDAIHAALAPTPDALGLAGALAPLDLADLNALLYRCEAEERAAAGTGVYEVPGHGPLPYAGLQGALSLLDELRARGDLGHALCDNLRAGDWLPDYTWGRLRAPRLLPVGRRLRDLLAPLKDLPRYLVPAYAEALLRAAHGAATRAALQRLAPACRAGALPRALALCSVQLTGAAPGAALPPPHERAPTLSAGLPHFAAGYMRCWGATRSWRCAARSC